MKKLSRAFAALLCLMMLLSLSSALACTKHQHEYVHSIKSCYLVSKATCTSPALYIESCRICGRTGEELFEYGKALGHAWSDYAYGAGRIEHKHAKVCSRCGNVQNACCNDAVYPEGTVCLGCGHTDNDKVFTRIDVASSIAHDYTRDPEVRVYGSQGEGNTLYYITIECAKYGTAMDPKQPMTISLVNPVTEPFTLVNCVSNEEVPYTFIGEYISFTAEKEGVFMLVKAE